MIDSNDYETHARGVREVQRLGNSKSAEGLESSLISVESAKPKLFGSEKIIGFLGKLALKPDEYTLIGGANLTLRGIKSETHDIDMLVSQAAFDQLRSRRSAKVLSPPHQAILRGATNKTIHIESPGSIPTSAFTYLSGNGYYPMSFDSVRPTSEIIEGIPLASLDQIVASKLALSRRKDIKDLHLIVNATTLDIAIPNIPLREDIEEENYLLVTTTK